MTPQSIYRLLRTEGGTDGIKHHNISAVHCVHLADIINVSVLVYEGRVKCCPWSVSLRIWTAKMGRTDRKTDGQISDRCFAAVSTVEAVSVIDCERIKCLC